MKICTKCKEGKPFDEFNKNKSRKDGYNNICRICSNTHSKDHYQLNKETHKKAVKERNNKVLEENRRLLFEFYKQNPCIDCGENNPIVLECDHRYGEVKVNTVSYLVGNAYSWSTIQTEIDKCDVRCANCHRIKTAKQLGWYKGLI